MAAVFLAFEDGELRHRHHHASRRAAPGPRAAGCATERRSGFSRPKSPIEFQTLSGNQHMAFTLSVTFPFDHIQHGEEFVSMAAVHECAKAAEAAGFWSGTVTDHPVPSYRWLDNGGHYAQDPFVMLSLVAAVTTKLRVQSNIIVLPYRNPFITARAVSSLERLLQWPRRARPRRGLSQAGIQGPGRRLRQPQRPDGRVHARDEARLDR
jgi:hypothetical protein